MDVRCYYIAQRPVVAGFGDSSGCFKSRIQDPEIWLRPGVQGDLLENRSGSISRPPPLRKATAEAGQDVYA